MAQRSIVRRYLSYKLLIILILAVILTQYYFGTSVLVYHYTWYNQYFPASKIQTQYEKLPLCPAVSPKLVGSIPAKLEYPSVDQLEQEYSNLELGGRSKPEKCRSRHRVAVVVPFRDRQKHLRCFLYNIHSMLGKQQLEYGIFVVEQVQGQTFNKGKLMNVGVLETRKSGNWQCVIFHDVDVIPDNDMNIYACPLAEGPRHLGVYMDHTRYHFSHFGGATAFTYEQFNQVNGYSNDFWGWGMEDDEMNWRVKHAGLKISRYPAPIALYKRIKHGLDKKEPTNPCNLELLSSAERRWKSDGINQVEYRLISRNHTKLYTHILVDLYERESRKKLASLECAKNETLAKKTH